MKLIRRTLRKALKTFMRVEVVPFNDNGKPAEYVTLYAFGRKVLSNVLPA